MRLLKKYQLVILSIFLLVLVLYLFSDTKDKKNSTSNIILSDEEHHFIESLNGIWYSEKYEEYQEIFFSMNDVLLISDNFEANYEYLEVDLSNQFLSFGNQQVRYSIHILELDKISFNLSNNPPNIGVSEPTVWTKE